MASLFWTCVIFLLLFCLKKRWICLRSCRFILSLIFVSVRTSKPPLMCIHMYVRNCCRRLARLKKSKAVIIVVFENCSQPMLIPCQDQTRSLASEKLEELVSSSRTFGSSTKEPPLHMRDFRHYCSSCMRKSYSILPTFRRSLSLVGLTRQVVAAINSNCKTHVRRKNKSQAKLISELQCLRYPDWQQLRERTTNSLTIFSS